VLPYVSHLHLKNVRPWEGHWPVCGLAEGIVDYERLFRRVPALAQIPMSIELPLRFGYDAQFRFGLRQALPVPSLDEIGRVLKDSLDCLVAWASRP
jgi:hypothetical protein